jgi:F-box domain
MPSRVDVVITVILRFVPKSPPIYSLPDELMEEIILYLPPSCYCSLALVSKTFSSWFRWRRIDSGSALSPSQSFNTLLKNPTNADFVREAIIHKSFFAPKIEHQWFLEGESDDVRATAWKNAQSLKERLLAKVLQNTLHLRRLVLTDIMELPPTITNIITDMCRTSLHTLDLFLEDCLLDLLGQDLTNVRDLTLRHGLYNGEQAARIVRVLTKFPRLSSLCFVYAEFDTNASFFFKAVMEVSVALFNSLR